MLGDVQISLAPAYLPYRRLAKPSIIARIRVCTDTRTALTAQSGPYTLVRPARTNGTTPSKNGCGSVPIRRWIHVRRRARCAFAAS